MGSSRAVGHHGLTPEARWLAAVKACGPLAALSHSSWAMLFELWPVEDRRPEVTIPATSKCRVEGIIVHRTRDVDRLTHKGIPTTSAARMILDLAPRLDDVPLRRLMSRAQSRHLTNLRLLGRQLDRAAGRHPQHDLIVEAERQALLEAHGQRVIRITWHQATAHAAQTVRRVTLALAGPGAEEPGDDSSSRAGRTTGTT